jgi:curved DNA-binding protein
MEYQDYYKILGVKRDASAAEIKKAYRGLARKYQPDVSKEPRAEERFKNISMAYEVLSNPEKKQAYDQLGSYQSGQNFKPPPDWERRYGVAGDFSGMSFSDLFEQIFAGFGSTPGASGFPPEGALRSKAVPAFQADVEISLEEASAGTERVFEIDGRKIRIRIPKGAQNGQKLRVPVRPRRGWNRMAGEGDLQITVRLLPHPLFRPVDDHLEMEVPITPAEAVLGTEVEIQTLKGRVRLRIPPATSSGQSFRLEKKGMSKASGVAGDLWVRVKIVAEKPHSERERELYEELLKIQRSKTR